MGQDSLEEEVYVCCSYPSVLREQLKEEEYKYAIKHQCNNPFFMKEYLPVAQTVTGI